MGKTISALGQRRRKTDARPTATLESVYEQTSIGIYRTKLDGTPVFASPALVRMMGFRDEQDWQTSVDCMHDSWYVEAGRRETFVRNILANGSIQNFESEVHVNRSDKTIWVSETATVVRGEAGEPVYFQGTIEDITSRKRLQTALNHARRKAERQSLEDVETGLPNRRALANLLLDCAATTGVAAFTIRRFNDIQSAVGYADANRLVSEIASRIAEIFPDDLVARVDEKTLAVPVDSADVDGAVEGLSAIVLACGRPVVLSQGAIDVQLTAGLAPAQADSSISLIDRARIAVEQAISQERDVAVFDADAYGDPTQTLSMMTDMLAAMEAGDFHVAYQPKFDLRCGEINGLEALARWTHPDKGPISPGVFIPAAETTGRIAVMTEWMIRKIIEEQKIMRACGIHARISINISGRLLNNRRFVSRTLDLLTNTDARLCFEITETMVIQNPKQALETIRAFRAQGIAISIDDYGTGLSSLSYLKQIPAHELKIDRTFVKDLLNTQSDRLLVKSTIDLAHALGMTVVAEGIEDFGTLRVLASLGADEAQGFCISRPYRLDHWVDNIGILPRKIEEVSQGMVAA